MKLWLKCGVIGAILGLVFIIVLAQYGTNPGGYDIDLGLKYMWLPLLITYGGPTLGGFLIGAIIGLIVGKIKSKKQ